MSTTKRLPRVGGRMLFATLLLGLIAAAGCDEEIDSALCKSAGNKICVKWFDCWPDVSAQTMTDVDSCRASMDAFCAKSDSWTRCEIENDEIRECDDGVEASDCGGVPYGCNKLKDCHDAN